MRSMVALLLFTFSACAGCAGNPPPQSLENAIAREGMALGKALDTLGDLVHAATQDGRLTPAKGLETQSNLRALNSLGIAMADQLKTVDTATNAEVRQRAWTAALQTCSTMKLRLASIQNTLSPPGGVPPTDMAEQIEVAKAQIDAIEERIRTRPI